VETTFNLAQRQTTVTIFLAGHTSGDGRAGDERGNITTWKSIPAEHQYWSNIYDQVHRGEIDTWDFSWAYALWKRNGLAILPETNLVTNLGFGETATHTTDPSSKLAGLPTGSIQQIVHPPEVERNVAADIFTWENIMAPYDIKSSQAKDQATPKRLPWRRRLLRSFVNLTSVK